MVPELPVLAAMELDQLLERPFLLPVQILQNNSSESGAVARSGEAWEGKACDMGESWPLAIISDEVWFVRGGGMDL